MSDSAEAPASHVLGEDTDDDTCFDGVDLGHGSWVLWVRRALLQPRRVAVAASAGVETGQGSSFQAPVRLRLDDLQERVVDERHGAVHEAGVRCVRRQFRRTVDDVDLRGQELAEDDVERVSQVAGQASQVVDEDALKGCSTTGARGVKHPLHIRAVEAGAALSSVLVLFHY